MHGYPVSNYFNIARAALIEKAVPHDIVITRASQEPEFLERSALGKIPVLEGPDGWIAETVAILEYLDDKFSAVSLRPNDLGTRAHARQIVNIAQVYVEVPCRALFPGVFAAGSVATKAQADALATIDRAVAAISRLRREGPFLLGDELTAADVFGFFTLDIAQRVVGFLTGRSILDEAGLRDWFASVAARPSTVAVMADFLSFLAPYLAERDAPYRLEHPIDA
ncbi:glutathione S-transferase family protein [Novosphingobium sp. KCTC 2891]|uniref:glutathione S-transferase family protein n=1 Tax=Novosphingobium sp. KCTC 2891 TaxID=2989730 RepID=UPI002221A2EA|nr:glutathione S-transferase family protein [Novosphingobium sp. KCTC 2891]MCW1383778.1 glutathione S-transferase family protein [Novosphingobium sp. KCTC 2891]